MGKVAPEYNIDAGSIEGKSYRGERNYVYFVAPGNDK